MNTLKDDPNAFRVELRPCWVYTFFNALHHFERVCLGIKDKNCWLFFADNTLSEVRPILKLFVLPVLSFTRLVSFLLFFLRLLEGVFESRNIRLFTDKHNFSAISRPGDTAEKEVVVNL